MLIFLRHPIEAFQVCNFLIINKYILDTAKSDEVRGGTAFQAEAIPRDITGYMGAKRTCARFLRCGLPGHVASFSVRRYGKSFGGIPADE